MNKPKSITQLSKEQLEDMCLNLMHVDKVKTEMINNLELDVDSYKTKYERVNTLYLELCDDLKQGVKIGVNIKVGDYINGDKIVNITNDMFVKGQIDIFTNTTKPFGGFGDREVVSYRIKKGVDENDT